MPKKSLITIAAIAVATGIVGAGVGFYVGTMPHFDQNNVAFKQLGAGTAVGAGQFRTTQGIGGNGNKNMLINRGGVVGEVIAMDDQSLTVKMADGSSKIILVADSTTYENTTKASKNDLQTGVQVRVLGITNNDGSITATNVALNPTMMIRTFEESNTPTPQPQP